MGAWHLQGGGGGGIGIYWGGGGGSIGTYLLAGIGWGSEGCRREIYKNNRGQRVEFVLVCL